MTPSRSRGMGAARPPSFPRTIWLHPLAPPDASEAIAEGLADLAAGRVTTTPN